MTVPVTAILWKRLSASDHASLRGIAPVAGSGGGQRDIRLRGGQIREFFAPLSVVKRDKVSQWRSVPVEASDGIASYALAVSHAETGARPNEWRLARQTPEDGYPQWVDRARSLDEAEFQAASPYVLIVRDRQDKFHARWVDASAVEAFPASVRDPLLARDQGVIWFDGPPDGLVREIAKALASDFNVLLYGPPGTGKTWAMTEVRRYFAKPTVTEIEFSSDISTAAFAEKEVDDDLLAPQQTNRRTYWMTFHQSYGYEEFVIGLRPISAGSGFALTPRPGPLLEAAEHARTSKAASLLLIDEINRANASRTFGELVTLIEPDKRLGADGKPTDRTVASRLPYLEGPYKWTSDGSTYELCPEFSMPLHVYLLASMNSVDRSVAPLDSALRRRFKVIELRPDYDLLEEISGAHWGELDGSRAASRSDWAALGIQLLRAVNDGIRALAGDDFLLGHSYLWQLTDRALAPQQARDMLAAIWDTKILPQLIELFRAQPDQLAVLLGSELEGVPASFPYRLQDLRAEYAVLGASAAVAAPPISGLGDEALEDALRWIARKPLGSSSSGGQEGEAAPPPATASPPEGAEPNT